MAPPDLYEIQAILLPVTKYRLNISSLVKIKRLFFLFAAVLVAPVVLNRVIQVVAEGVQQPVMVEKECQEGGKRSCVHIVQVVVVT